jgi:hypothetical protein
MTLAGANSVGLLTLLVSAITISWCVYIVRRIYNRELRVLAILMSFLVVFQGLKYGHQLGLFRLADPLTMERCADLAMAVLALAATLVIRAHNRRERSQSMRLRLAEAEQAEIKQQKPQGGGVEEAIVRPLPELLGGPGAKCGRATTTA